MSHFNRVRAPGLWVSGDPLFASEMEALDADHAKAINGDEGGAWNPSSTIIIGGLGIKVNGQLWSTGGFKSDGPAVFNNGLNVLVGNATFAAAVTVSGNLNANGNAYFAVAVEVTGSSTLGGTVLCQSSLTVNGTSLLKGNVTCQNPVLCQSTLTVTGAITGSATLSVTGTCTLAGGALAVTTSSVGLTVPGIPTGAGRWRKRITAIATNANQTLSVETTDILRLPLGVWTATRSVTVSATGADEGDTVTVMNDDATYSINLNGPGGYLSTTIAPAGSGEAMFTGGFWRLLRKT